MITVILSYHYRLKQWLLTGVILLPGDTGHWLVVSGERVLLQEVDKGQKRHLTCCPVPNSPQQTGWAASQGCRREDPAEQPAVEEGAIRVSVLFQDCAAFLPAISSEFFLIPN